MLGVYAFLIAGLAAALATRPIRPDPGPERLPALDVRVLIALAGALVAVTGWHEHLVAVAAAAQRPLPAWLASLPAVPVRDVAGAGLASAPVSALAEIASLLETGLLAALAAVCVRKRLSRAGWAVAASTVTALATIALTARGMLSADVYAYVADGLFGRGAYRPEPGELRGAFAPVALLWGDPPPACAYGPAWLLPATLLVHGVRDLGDGVLRFRLAGAACVVGIALAMLRLRAPLAVVAAFAFNPAIWMLYVADAHNDAWPVALVLAGRLAARAPVAALFAGAAGAAKLPFAAIGALCGAGRSVRARIAIATGSIAISVAASALFGGAPYARALVAVSRLYATPSPAAHGALVLALLGTLAALSMALGPARTAWPAAFSFAALGVAPFPWYALWGLPYALASDGAAAFLCLLPLASFVSATAYVATPLWPPLLAVAFAVAALYAYRCARRLRLRSARP